MPRAITYNCDVCGAQRKEANHWFVAIISTVGVSIITWESAARDGKLDYDVKYLCGQACAHKLLDQFLQSTSESE
jgi:hypothetical protein